MFAKRVLAWLALLAIITFSVWGASARLEAQTQLDEVLPARLEMLVYPPTEENSAELAAVLAQMAQPDTQSGPPNFHLPATLLVYQNFDTGNWEILLNTATQAKINLSNHPAADIHPRLNRGATHVVFASNRAGNFDLYMMKVDGSNLTRLTASAGDDVNPVWSPDGTKIAFESYRDGQAEIYVMNADGSNQTRLTASPDFDGMPTWSPDGQTIAFSSRRTGGYRIYTMDAATGANQIQRSTHAYSLSPAWSPDGGKIVFSATRYTFQIWLDAYAIEVSEGGFQELSYSSIEHTYFSQTADIWIRGWTPDSQQITYDVRYYANIPNTQLYDLEKLEIYVSYQKFNNNDVLSINPDVNTLDIIPPSFSSYLPILTPQNGLLYLTWTGTDTGIGKILYSDFQIKLEGSNQWQNWFRQWKHGGKVPYNLLMPPSGTTLQVRQRATDTHLNTSAWRNIGSTTLYEWYFKGQILDNREQPIAQAPLQITEATLSPVHVDSNGVYEAFSISSNGHQVSLLHEEDTLITPTTLSLSGRTAIAKLYAHGLNNLTNNASFENDLAHWVSLGNTLVNSNGVTGSKSVQLGGVCYTCIVEGFSFPWATDFDDIAQINLVADTNGNVHLFFSGYKSLEGIYQEYHSYVSPTGEWAELQPIPIESAYGAIVAGKHGDLHLFQHTYSGDGFQHVVISENNQWSSPQVIFQKTTGYAIVNTKFIIDDEGGLHVFLDEIHGSGIPDHTFYIHRPPSGQWNTPEFIAQTSSSMRILGTVLPNGEVHIFQWQSLGYPSGINYGYEWHDFHIQVIQKIRRNDGTWVEKSRFLLRDVSDGYSVQYIPTEKRFYLRNWENAFTYNELEGWMKVPANYYSTSISGLVYEADAYTLSIKPPYGINEEFPIEYFQYGSHPSLDLYGALHYAHKLNNHTLVYYGPRSFTPQIDQTHTLAQVVTIPADMPNPTVSLMYRTVRDLPGDDTQFEVRLTNGISTTTHVLPPTAVLWEHAWFDASEWAGETVTLTLAAVQRAGDPLIRVDLDDVSLGSAAPDTWVKVAAPQAAMPSDQLTISLNYGNLSPDLLAPTATLTFTLPAGLTVNSINVTPTVQTAEHIIWQLGDLPANTSGAITLTATVNSNVPRMSTLHATAELRTTLPEPSWGNNEHSAALFIGRRAYLPAIFK